jgi:hypothetical protein
MAVEIANDGPVTIVLDSDGPKTTVDEAPLLS